MLLYDASGNVTKETNVTVENDKTKTTVTTYTYDDMGNLLTTQSEKDSAAFLRSKIKGKQSNSYIVFLYSQSDYDF